MTVETDVCKEVIAVEDKCGSDINSGQDLVSSDCNGNDVNPDNSYVFVSETDGLGDDHVQTKERDSESVIEPETLKGDHIENVAVNDDPVVNEQVEGDVLERQGSEVDECGVSDVEIVANNDESVGKVVESDSDRVEVGNGGVEISVVTDLGGLSSDQNGKLGNVEGLNEVIESSAGDHEDGIMQDGVKSYDEEAKDENIMVENGDHQDEIVQDEVKIDGEEAKDDIETHEQSDHHDRILQDEATRDGAEAKDEIGTVESSDRQDGVSQDETNSDVRQAKDEIETLESGDHQDGILQDVEKSDVEQPKDESETLERLEGSETEVVADPIRNLEDVVDNEIERVEDTNERIDSSISEEIRESDHQNVNSPDEAKSDIEQAQDASRTLESLDVSASEVVAMPNENIQNGDENDIKQAGDQTIKSLGEADMETVSDQPEKLESVARTEIRELEDPNAKVESLGVAESEMVSDQHEKIELGAESEIKEVEDVNEISESLAGDETEKVRDRENEAAAESVNVADRKNDGESGTELVADHKDESLAGDDTEKAKDRENVSVLESVSVADQKNYGDSETELVADHKDDGAAEAEIVTNKSNESGVEDEKVVESDDVADHKNEGLLETETVTDETNESVVETEKADQTNESAVETENVTDQTNEWGEKTELQKFEDQVEPESSAEPIDNQESQVQNTELFNKSANDNSESVVYEESQSVIDDPIVSEFQELSSKGQNEIKLAETVNDEIPPATTMVTNSEARPVDSNVETLEEQANVALVSDAVENQKYETESVIQRDPQQVDEVETVANGDDKQVEVVRGIPEETIEKNISVSHVEDIAQNGEEPEKPSDVNSVSSKLAQTDSEIEASVNQPDSVDVKLESGSNLVSETADVEDTGNQVDSPKDTTEENLDLQQNMDIENSQSEGVSGDSKEDSSAGTIIENETSIATIRPFNYIMRVPRFNDESLKERIIQAKLQIEEKTKIRDAIQSQIQQIRANGQIHGVDYEYAKSEIRNARKLLRAKRVEIDSLHSVINKAKNAISIEDIDTRIYSMEHMMQHETLPLKEEKQFIREIKQLKSLRDELSSNMGSDDEIKQALEQREEAEERLKVLRKELEKLKGDVQKAESSAMEAERKYEDENKKVKELQAEFRAANDVRQEAYAQWLSLRKELSEKNKYFFKYKDDNAAANNYAFRRDRESLYRLCTDQVEHLMELWNTDETFRKEYVSFNVRSTVRRFGTLDGRALSPDEEPPILPSYVDERFHRFVSTPTPTNTNIVSKSVMELKSEVTVEKGTVNDKSVKKITENVNQKVKGKETAEPVLANGLPTTASLQAPDEMMNEPVKSREEIELDRKAEEMRKKEDEAKLKEQRRLEGLAKANEARERKKRQAEKMQVRAELKARKEAEEKEKEREKRLRKKEKKKGTDSIDGNNNSDSAPSSESAIENVREIDAREMASVVAKKPQKIVKSNKKVSSIPAHIRNRNKKKWQNYAYITVAGLLVLILFWVGNVSLFTDKTFKKPNPFH